MKKYILYFYEIIVLAVIIISCGIWFNQNNVMMESRYNRDYTMIEYYNIEKVENSEDPCGFRYVYSWKLENISETGAACTFYSVHQSVYYYVDDELAGKLEYDKNNRIGKTTYADWATVFLSKADEGKKIRVEVVPLYESSGHPEEFYFGDYSTICWNVIKSNLVIIVIGIILVLIGIGFFIFGIVTRKNTEADRGVTWLGVFSIFAGIWKLTDMRAAPIMFGHPQALGFITLIVLPFVVIPYLNFIQMQFKHKNEWAWNALGIISVVQCFAVIVLQMAGIVDLRVSLNSTHVVILVCIVSIIVLIFVESRYARWSTKLTVTIVCSLLCLVGTCVDMLIYYLKGDSGTVIFCVLAFLVYIVCMGFLSIRETKQLMEWGREAKHYQQIAMHDELTGLFSRAFYGEYLSRNDFDDTDCSVIMFDMNHLKKSNDTYGHAFGDQRLKDFANILSETFSEIGKVCRFGGDEFCVLISKSYTKEWKAYLDIYNQRIEEYNTKTKEDIPLNAAYGYATFDPKEDEDFASTIRRADKMMYEMKVHMKMVRSEGE